MKDMFEKDHFRFLFLALVLVSVAMLVPCMRVSAAQTEQHFAVHYWGLGNNPLSEESVYDVRVIGESPVYIFAYHYSGEYSYLGYAYYAISKSAFTVSSDSPRMSNLVVGKLKKNGDEYSNSSYAVGEIQLYYSLLDSGVNGRFSDNYVSMEFDSFNSSSDSLLFLISVNDYLNGDYTGWDFSHSDTNLSHSQELGALAGLHIRYLNIPVYIRDEVGNLPSDMYSEYYNKIAYKISFNSRSTTGYLLKNVNDTNGDGKVTLEDGSPNTVVRVWSHVCYYNKDGTIFLESPDIDIGSFDPSDLYFLITSEMYDSTVDSQLSSEYKLSNTDLIAKGLHRSDTLFLQIVDKTKGFGDIIRVKKFFQYENGDYRESDIVDQNGNIVSGSSVTIDSGSAKPGGTFDDADDAANNGTSWTSPWEDATIGLESAIKSAVSVAQDMVSLVGNIPVAISKLFSFLPPWCLQYLGIVFVALGALILYKIIRG